VAARGPQRHLGPHGDNRRRGTGLPVLVLVVLRDGCRLDPGMEPPDVADPPPNAAPGLSLSERRRLFWIIEVVLVASFLLIHFGVGLWDWWRHGERVTGTVIAIDNNADGIESMTIVDPVTERKVKVHPDLDAPQKEVGDSATAVVNAGDANKVATPADLASYLVGWAALGVLACGLPIWCRRRYGMFAVGQFGCKREIADSRRVLCDRFVGHRLRERQGAAACSREL